MRELNVHWSNKLMERNSGRISWLYDDGDGGMVEMNEL